MNYKVLVAAALPASFVQANTLGKPVLLIHGEDDKTVPINNRTLCKKTQARRI